MAVWSIVLRLLLAAGLILNGSGVAAATVSMHQMGMAGAMQHPAAGPAAATPACGEHHHDKAPAFGADGAQVACHDAMPAASAHAPSDCCQATTCGCACANPVCLAVLAVAFVAAMPGRADMSQAMDLGRPAPALQGVIRPPIG